MNIAVCEDSLEDRDALCYLLERYFRSISCTARITTYESGESFLRSWDARSLEQKSEDVKIAFLDVYMPGMSGIEVARKIRETDDDMAIIFTTSSKDYAVEGFSVQALHYLIKPIIYPQVENVLNRCVKQFSGSLAYIEVLSDRIAVKILLKDIMYIEIFDHACLIHTESETIKCYRSLDEIERQLAGMEARMFLRTHRSFIVNMRYINDTADSDFLLKDGTAVPIRKKDKLAVNQAYRDYLFSLLRGM